MTVPGAGDSATLRLHIGGTEPREGWAIFSIQAGPGVDFVGDCRDLSRFCDKTCTEIYASHVYEHLSHHLEVHNALREAYRVLAPGGRLRISVPDLEMLCRTFLQADLDLERRLYLMRVMFGGQTDPHDFHKIGLTWEFLTIFLAQAGFVDIRRVEQFGLFDDCSTLYFEGQPISLNVEAYRPAEPTTNTAAQPPDANGGTVIGAGIDSLDLAFLKSAAFGLAQRGEMADARALYLQITRQAPQDAEAWFHLAAVHEALGLHPQAQENYRRTIALDPHHAQAHNNLGALMELAGELQQARHHYQLAVEANTALVAARFNLGAVLNRLGIPSEALKHLQLVSGEISAQPQVGVQLALALKALGQHREAREHLATVLRHHPDHVPALNLLANLQQISGELETAIAIYKHALAINPSQAELHNNLGSALLAQGRIADAVASYRLAARTNPQWAAAHSNLLLALNYAPESQANLYAEHLAWGARHGRADAAPAPANRREPGRKLRLGYVSADLRTHSVAYFIEALLAGHDRQGFEVFAYADIAAPDETTARLRGMPDHWRDIHGRSDEQACATIRNDGIDILVDLGGHTSHNRLTLFAHRPAPVQVTYLGYPNTTGMDAIGYRFTDRWADPQGSDGYTEELVRLEGGFLCYAAPLSCPAVAPLPAGRDGTVTFGSFNTLAKLTPQGIELWATILKAVPGTRLILKNTALGDHATQQRCREQFERHGIDGGRLELLGRTSSIFEHLASYNRVDVGLDTFPYNGTTTTCEALWMGVPVITLTGATHAGRVGTSLLTQAGLAELVAGDADQYVTMARDLAIDIPRLTQLRASLRERLRQSPLCDQRRLVNEIETHYRRMWQKWCETGC